MCYNTCLEAGRWNPASLLLAGSLKKVEVFVAEYEAPEVIILVQGYCKSALAQN